MRDYVVRRLLLIIPILFGISLISFFLVRLIPGDTVTIMLGPLYSEEQAAILRARYGLDRSLAYQYWVWISGVVKGDLGYSFFTGQPVLRSIIERLPVTLELAAISIFFAVFVGIPIGTWAAVRRNGLIDYFSGFFGMLGISVPGFWLGTIFILFFSLGLGLFPSGGFVGLDQGLWANLRYMIMPGIALGMAVSAVVMRMSRSAMLEVINQDYIAMARVKGVPERRLIFRHALKNALIPIITVIGIQAGYLLGGSVVIEQVFSLPGIGRLVLQAINNRDYILLQGAILFIAFAFVVINLMVDILYALINPKISYRKEDL